MKNVPTGFIIRFLCCYSLLIIVTVARLTESILLLQLFDVAEKANLPQMAGHNIYLSLRERLYNADLILGIMGIVGISWLILLAIEAIRMKKQEKLKPSGE